MTLAKLCKSLLSVNMADEYVDEDGSVVERISATITTTNETVYIMKSGGYFYVALGELPSYGSPPLSERQAAQMIMQAAG